MMPPSLLLDILPPNSRRPWPSAKPLGRSASQRKNSHARSPAVRLIGLEIQNLEITTLHLTFEKSVTSYHETIIKGILHQKFSIA